MRFSYFPSVRAQRGRELTYDLFLELTERDEGLKALCAQIASEPDHEKQGKLKKGLPIVTWQAYFAGKRLASEAEPSGLFILDIDGVEDPYALWKQIAGQRERLGIMAAHKTPSCKGLRLVAKCLPTLSTLEQCQRWLAGNLKVDYDAVCKDFARSSFLVPADYFYFLDGGIWTEEAAVGTRYAGGKNAFQENAEMEAMFREAQDPEPAAEGAVDQREGLFGGQESYRGYSYESIIKLWFEQNGGEPSKGERNTKLFKLATRLRYITDFNEATLLRIMPGYGLSEDEMKSIIHSACGTARASTWPKDLDSVLKRLEMSDALTGDEELDEDPLSSLGEKLPPMPPVIRQFVETAPDDFKSAVALCQLPILGTLGSKLRARYLDGELHSPSFQVSLEAPQASGKSFVRKLVEYELSQLIEHDNNEREKEREYDSKVKELKLLNVKVTVDNKKEVLGSRPKTLIRYIPATISITKLLQRLESAQGLHLFAAPEEIDTVTKAFKRQISSYSDLLRVAFDNAKYGQDYASENSFSGNLRVYYNMLSCGTPKAMRRFYPDVEDGLVSRVLFVTLPDQFGKRLPVWKELSKDQKQLVDINLVRLNEISLIGDEVQEEHVIKMEWLNKEMQRWILTQQNQAVKDNDRTRDVFCRRSAVVGFRAGMLGYFLYGEKNTPTIRSNVAKFARWVADCMLNQHLLRFNIQNASSNTNPYEETYKQLPDEFSREDLRKAIIKMGVETPIKNVIYRWRLGGLIEVTSTKRGKKNMKTNDTFRKIK